MIIFNPEKYKIDIEKNYGFCLEAYIEHVAPNRKRLRMGVSNAVTVFVKGNKLLPFYIFACGEIIRNNKKLYHFSVGTKFLTALNYHLNTKLIKSVGLFSPSIMNDIASGHWRLTEFYRKGYGSQISAANLCATFRNKDINGIVMNDELYDLVIKKLTESKGNIVNRHIQRG